MLNNTERKPRSCVWELTLACNLRCKHCGSRAGSPRPDELTTAESFDLVTQLYELGCERITLSGGEPTLRDDWHKIAQKISEAGIYVNMITNGVYPKDKSASDIAQKALDSGMKNAGVSIDGPEGVHDAIRGKGTFSRAFKTINKFISKGLKVAVITTVNQKNLDCLEEIHDSVVNAGVSLWRVQLGKPMGNLSDHQNLVISPESIPTLLNTLVRLKKARKIKLSIGDSVGYFSRQDALLRDRNWKGNRQVWQGCQAGLRVIGIEANGGIKGCLSLQTKWDTSSGRDPFLEGSLRDNRLAEIWNHPETFSYNRKFSPDSLEKNCKICRYGSICRAGAKCVSAAFTGSLTYNPYCYYAQTVLQRPTRGRFIQHSAAAASLVLALGLTGCPKAGDPKPDPANPKPVDCAKVDCNDELPSNIWNACCEPQYNLEYGIEPIYYEEYGYEPIDEPDYGVEPYE